jgi:hypothetical protein
MGAVGRQAGVGSSRSMTSHSAVGRSVPASLPPPIERTLPGSYMTVEPYCRSPLRRAASGVQVPVPPELIGAVSSR